MENLELNAKAKSDEELLTLAKAKEYFERLNNSGELSDEELDNVSGGCGDFSYKTTSLTCMKCKQRVVSVTNKKTGEKWCKCGCGTW